MSHPTEYPYSLTLVIPFPSDRLANITRKAIEVDSELSPLVRRSLTTLSSSDKTKVIVEYAATTNRMLRVATNSFLSSLNLIVDVMENLEST